MGWPKHQRDCSTEAIELFTRFAARHGLTHMKIDAPVEVFWEFPVQAKLSHRIVLGLQNNDELNFGVGDFWSYFSRSTTKKSNSKT